MQRATTIGTVVVVMLVCGTTAVVAGPLATASEAGPPGFESSAASRFGWGRPNKAEDFSGPLGPNWSLYNGPGHAGNGRRTPDAVSVHDGMLTITGDSAGATEGMAWGPGQKYGRWEGRVRAPASDPSYNALLLLWPDAENFPVGGEVDFMEMSDHTRQSTEMFLHYGADNNQVSGKVRIDATQWHNWAVEWTPDHIATFVDGNEWFRTTDRSILPPGPMHMTIQLDWFPKGGSVQESHMDVDWVRRYPLETVAGPDGTTTTVTPAPTSTAAAASTSTPTRTSVPDPTIRHDSGPTPTTAPATTSRSPVPTTPPATTRPAITPPAATLPPTTLPPTTPRPPTTTRPPTPKPTTGRPPTQAPGQAPVTQDAVTPAATTPAATTQPPVTSTVPPAPDATLPAAANGWRVWLIWMFEGYGSRLAGMFEFGSSGS